MTYVLEHESSKRLLATMPPDGPSRGCAVCGAAQLRLVINTRTATLARLVSQARHMCSDVCIEATRVAPCGAPCSRRGPSLPALLMPGFCCSTKAFAGLASQLQRSP